MRKIIMLAVAAMALAIPATSMADSLRVFRSDNLSNRIPRT